RRRRDDQSGHRAGHDLRRDRARHRRGALREVRLHRGRATRERHLHGLSDPERDGSAGARHRRSLHALAPYDFRSEGLRRSRLSRRARRNRECDQRRAGPAGNVHRSVADVASRDLEGNQRGARESGRNMKNIVIDVHAHFIPKLLYERYEANAAKFPGVKLLRDGKGTRMQFPGGDPTRPISPKLSDTADRCAWMDKNGIDHQLVGGWLDSFGYELPPAEGLAWSRYINACMKEELIGQTRFTPLATVPLQDGALAAKVLTEAMEAEFGGLMIGTLPKGQGGNLDDPGLDPFWQAASDLKAGVFLHPMFLCGEPRLADYDLVNAIGRVADTSIAVARLLHSGHLLKYPGVKLVVSH